MPGVNRIEISCFHDGLDDAVNTGYLIEKLELNPEYQLVSYEMTDERIQEFMKAEKWVDYQEVFTKRFELSRRLSLEEALGRAEIDPEGRFHDGLDMP